MRILYKLIMNFPSHSKIISHGVTNGYLDSEGQVFSLTLIHVFQRKKKHFFHFLFSLFLSLSLVKRLV